MSKKINEIFSEFMNPDQKHDLPKEKEASFLIHMKRRISPTLKEVLPKFLSAQLIATLATLSVCPQFGIGPIGGGHGIGHYFMRFGEAGCAAFCGMVFLTTGTIVAMLLLRNSERRQIFNYQYRLISSFALVSFMALMMINRSFDLPTLFDGSFANAMWVAGAVLPTLFVLKVWQLSSGLAENQQ